MTTCPHCAESAPADALWCEACGADLAAAPGEAEPAPVPDSAAPLDADTQPAPVAAFTEPCVACAAPPVDITHDGYCQQCGQRQPLERDHQVEDLGWLAGVSDKGRKHHRNEDAMAFEGAGGVGSPPAVLIVCDGVSSTERPDEASDAAADAALGVLSGSAGDEGTFAEATAAAKASVSDVWRSSAQAANPPSCTLVAAVATETEAGVDLSIGWLGDSRAYWVAPDSTELLTTDHSWAQEQRTLGELADDVIDSDPRAHSITRWLGVDAGDVTPTVESFSFARPGQLVVCSDGLWNYADLPDAMGALIADRNVAAESGGALTPIELAESLVEFANESGGHDNITVVIARYDELGDPAEADQ